MRWPQHLAFALAVAVHGGAYAQSPPTSTAAAAKPAIPAGFEPIVGKEAKAESVNASTMVVGAYAAVLALIFGFVVHVVRSQAELAREMRELAERIEKGKRS
ncbi:MAG: hypothetical protein HY791_13940 [Deltaproteobacteria bacterium]|nr:hypothetical protein [Deltaproteobacteria bacterium]